MRFQNSPKSAFPGHFRMKNSEREVLSAGHATTMNEISIKLVITVTDDK